MLLGTRPCCRRPRHQPPTRPRAHRAPQPLPPRAPGSLNASKGKLDAGELSVAEQSLFSDELTAEGRCFWAAQTVRVKRKYSMSVDTQERDALAAILLNCETEQTSVARPVAPVECEWAVRPEFAAAVAGTPDEPGAYCADALEDQT